MMDVVKVVPINHCEICPFGVIKDIMTDNPKLFCQRSNKLVCEKPVATKPPEWCELTDLEELVLKNRHEVVKIIEKAYGPIHINPFKPHKKPEPWQDTTIYKEIYKKYWMERLQSLNAPKRRKPNVEHFSSTKAKKRGRKK
jgi:hypothetical protein